MRDSRKDIAGQSSRVTMQTKKDAHLEVIINQMSGIVMGWLIVFYIFPLIGIPVTAPQATLSTLIFFVSSYSRMYVIRRIFNNKLVKKTERTLDE